MSYNLHVTRKKHWFDENHRLTIPGSQFLSFMKTYPGVTILEESGDEVDTIFTDLHADEWHIVWRQGLVTADMRMVPREVMLILVDLAVATNANVQGDDGERYTRASAKDFKTIDDLREESRLYAEQQRERQRKEQLARRRRQHLLIVKRVCMVALMLCTVIGWILLPFVLYRWHKQDTQARH